MAESQAVKHDTGNVRRSGGAPRWDRSQARSEPGMSMFDRAPEVRAKFSVVS